MRSNEILGYHAPIAYDRKEKSYYYADASYSLSESPINRKDKRTLEQALAALRQFAGFREMIGIQSIITKLQHSIDFREKSLKPVIQFDHPEDAPGQNWLYTLYQAILDKRSLNILYQPFGRQKSTYLMSPYLLKEYRQRWYLIGFAANKAGMRTLALDRIRDIRETFESFRDSEEFDIRHYFDHIVGITLDHTAQKEEIVFEAYGVQVDYLLTRPIHKSQVLVRKENDRALFKIYVIPNYELISEICSFREHIRILSPAHIMEMVKEAAQNMSNLY